MRNLRPHFGKGICIPSHEKALSGSYSVSTVTLANSHPRRLRAVLAGFLTVSDLPLCARDALDQIIAVRILTIHVGREQFELARSHESRGHIRGAEPIIIEHDRDAAFCERMLDAHAHQRRSNPFRPACPLCPDQSPDP